MKTKNFRFKNHSLPLGKKTYIMGILNVTPDSFSDGGKYNNLDKAVIHALKMIDEGADIIDIGGESTRPNHIPVSADEELSRIMPVIEKLHLETDIPISLDTQKSEVALEGAKAGVDIINDIWGLQHDPKLADIAAQFGCGVIICHNREKSGTVNTLIPQMMDFYKKSIEIASKSGLSPEQICIDPGVGFGKSYEENLAAIRNLNKLSEFNLPLLLAVSRKSVIGNTLNVPSDKRLEGSIALAVLGAEMGADIVRVHDVLETSLALKMTDKIIREV